MSARDRAFIASAAFFLVFVLLGVVFWAEATASQDGAAAAWSTAAGVLGGPAVLPLLVLGAAATLLVRERVAAARFLLLAVAGAGLAMYASRVVLQLVGADEDGGRLSDYPSGHATAITAVAAASVAIVFAETRRRWARAVAAASGAVAVVVVSAARLATGAHAPIDLVGGVALALGWTTLCVAVVPPSGDRAPTRRAWLVGLAASAVLGFVLLAIAYGYEPLASADAESSEWVASSLPGWVQDLARPFSWLGGWFGITALTIAAVVLLARERSRLDVGFVLAAVVGSQIAVALLKAWIDRARPAVGHAVPLPESAAFSSGHATSGIAALGAFTILAAERMPSRRARAWLWTGAVLVGLAVGLARIALNVDFVTDVLAGWCFGLAWLAGCLLVRDRLRASG